MVKNNSKQQGEVLALSLFRAGFMVGSFAMLQGYLPLLALLWWVQDLVAILLQPFLDPYCYLALQVYVRDLPIESIDCRQMLSQEAAFEAVSINGFHHWLEQDRKGQCEPLSVLRRRVLQHVVV